MVKTGEGTGVTYDWDKIGGVASSLNSSLTKFKAQVDEIYSSIATMGSSWSGASYDAFKTYCDDYKKNQIDELSSKIELWVNKIETLSESAKTTQTNNKNLFQGQG